MKRTASAPAAPINWTRADPKALAAFDPDTKVCTMNCGPAAGDPRTSKERKFLCDECMPAPESAYKPGDPPPGGYLNWHAWAEVQDRAGLRQKQCSRCGLWKFPQELNGATCPKCTDSAARVAPTQEQQP